MPKAVQQDSRLQRELERRRLDGRIPVTVRQMNERLAQLGYKLDRSRDCPCNSRHMTGPHAGESYPAVTTGVREIDSGLSFAHVDARRDGNFEALQKLRLEDGLFAVTRGRILEI